MIIATGQEAAALFGPFFTNAEAEKVMVAHLAAGMELLALQGPLPGGATEAELPIRAIVAAALAHHSVAIVVAHNHPSGDPDPSEADMRATRRLAAVARELDIRLLDHLIFAGGEFRSFRALGLL